ncbi:hypothetical protein H8356DRAFT_1274861 [Neocallimastix lanati (nom. inval.)]|nr:hypothetical protein H8356DRAFT_1274861 [Neocallimastix sp. JGI-2020a]
METDKNGEDIVFNEKPNPTGEVVGIIKINWEQHPFGHFICDICDIDIADVTYFFKPYTALFRINLCSLRSNVDCLTFSCILELTSKTEVVNVHFTKSVILSKVLLIYEKTQDRNGDGYRMVQQASKKLLRKKALSLEFIKMVL